MIYADNSNSDGKKSYKSIGTPRLLGFMLVCMVAITGCASVPNEVVQLSVTIGRDVRAIQRSYDSLITARFDAFRQERLDYLNNEWTPAFLEDWVASGRLIDTAEGKVVYSDAQDDFIPPDPSQAEQQRLVTILQWSQAAVAQIDAKRNELIDPLNERERQVRAEMNAAFNQVISANAQITAHLNSIRKVKELQNNMLKEVGAGGEIAQLNQKILDVSDWAQKGLDEIRKADKKLN